MNLSDRIDDFLEEHRNEMAELVENVKVHIEELHNLKRDFSPTVTYREQGVILAEMKDHLNRLRELDRKVHNSDLPGRDLIGDYINDTIDNFNGFICKHEEWIKKRGVQVD